MRRQFVAGFLIFITLSSAFNPMSINAPQPKLLDFVQSDFFKQLLSLSKSNGGENSCTVCKNVMATMKSSLANPIIKSDVSKIVSQMCSKMADKSYQYMCSSVSNYLSQIMESIAKNVDPQSACEETFKVCQSSSPANPLMLKSSVNFPPQETADIECATCTWLTVFVVYGVLSPASGQALGWEIAEFCVNYIGDPEKEKTCISDAQQIAEIFPVIPSLISPAVVCQNYLKVCTGTIP